MRTNFIKSLGLLLMFSACQKENNEIVNSDLNEPVSVSFSSQISRVTGTQWGSDDEVGISATDGSGVDYVNVKYLSDVSGNFSVPQEGEPICYKNQNAMSFTAYYPYSSTVSENLITGNTLSNNEMCNFLWSKVENVEYSTTPSVNFTFNHSMAELRIELTYPEGTNVEAYKNVTVIGLKHEGTFNITNGETAVTATDDADWNVVMEQTDGKLSYSGVFFPQKVSDLKLVMNGLEFNLVKSEVEFVKGNYYTINATINADGSVKVSMKISGATIEDYNDGGVANIAFVSTGENVEACDDEAKAAYKWLASKYSKVTYIPVTYIGGLSEYDLVWAHISKNSDYGYENTYAIDNSMNTYYTNGGKVIASKGASVSINKWGIAAIPNNCFRGDDLNKGVAIYVNNTTHPIFKDIKIETGNNIWLHGEGFSGTAETYQWANLSQDAPDMGQDWTNGGGECLASDGNKPNTTVRIAEFKNSNNRAAAIVIGDPAYIWKGTNTGDDATLVKLTVNTIEYLLNL